MMDANPYDQLVADKKFTKDCHRCEEPVRMTQVEFAAHPTLWTTCDRCRAVLAAEVKYIGTEPKPLTANDANGRE